MTYLPQKLHVLKFLSASQTAPLTGEQVFKCMNIWRTTFIQTTTPYIFMCYYKQNRIMLYLKVCTFIMHCWRYFVPQKFKSCIIFHCMKLYWLWFLHIIYKVTCALACLTYNRIFFIWKRYMVACSEKIWFLKGMHNYISINFSYLPWNLFLISRKHWDFISLFLSLF